MEGDDGVLALLPEPFVYFNSILSFLLLQSQLDLEKVLRLKIGWVVLVLNLLVGGI